MNLTFILPTYNRSNDLVNLYKKSGCRPKGRLHPDNIKATVKADARKKHGVGKEWTSGTFYKWKPNEYLAKLTAIKQRADKLANKAIGITSCPYNTKIYLNVPFNDKDDAKKLGAKWDYKKKKWYIFDNNVYKTQMVDNWGN